MRTVRTKVYQFSELDNTAKEKAISQFRNNGIDTDYIYDDAHESVKAFHELFNTKEGNRSWLECNTNSIDDNVLQLTGLRLQKYIWNNYGQSLYKGKFYNYKNNTPNKLVHKRIKSIYYTNSNSWGNYYYSAITKDNSCVLTGVCYDNSLLHPIYDFLENYNAKKDYYSYMDFETLMNDCFTELEKDIENEVEAQNEDSAIIETIEGNDYEFTKEGNRF